MRFGFVGPNYQSASPLADAEALINWRVQRVESPNARTPFVLLRTPGTQVFVNLGNFPDGVRAINTFNGRTFAVAGSHLFEIPGVGIPAIDYGAGGITPNNNISDDGLPVTMVTGGTVGGAYPSQILIAAGGQLTVFSIASNTFQPITTPPTQVLMVDFLDGFFIALSGNNTWSVSAPEDATTWPGLAVTQVAVFSDQLLALIATNRLLWVFGAKRAVAYYNSGAPLFPFDVVNGGFMEVGIFAQYSVARIALKSGTTIAWVGGDERGAAVVYFANGFLPQKVSDSGLDFWLSQQRTVSDAQGWAWQFEGQNYYSLWFPSANTTWTLDADNGWWFKQASTVAGAQAAWTVRSHSYSFNTHLGGDRLSGNVYALSTNFLTDNGNPIVRVRVGPTISNEGGQLTVPINEFQIDADIIGPQPPLTDNVGNPRDPMVMVEYSEDYGRSYGPQRFLPASQTAAVSSRRIVRDTRLGSWRSWTPRITVSDPVAINIVDAYTNSTQDSKPRYLKNILAIQ